MTILSPTSFHAGELAAQDKAGTRGVAAELGVVKRSALNFSSNHDAFLAAQSFAVVSSVAADKSVWVTPLFGKAGDVTAASEKDIFIAVNCIPKDDILLTNAALSDTPLSLLGIDLRNRIRHRINGVAGTGENKNLLFRVTEYSPNCPK